MRKYAHSNAMGNLIRSEIVIAVCPLHLLLIWGGVRDHITAKYGKDTGFT